MFKIESTFTMARAAFNKKTTPFTSKLDLSSKEEQCYIWSRVVYCAEMCTSEMLGRFWNVVLGKDGEDQLDWLCEKL